MEGAFQIPSLTGQFHDLQTNLQTEFSLLKKATLQNIENLQEAITLQQNYTSTLCGHVSSIYAKLAQLDRQVQMHCLYPHSQSDVVQINASKYNSDIDRLNYYQISHHLQPRTLPALQKINQMPKTSKKILSQSLPIQKNIQPIGLNLSPHKFQMI